MAGLILTLLLALATLAGASPARAQQAPPAQQSIPFERIEAVRSDWHAEAPPEAGWVAADVPDLWLKRWPGHEGVVWYRLHWHQRDTALPVALMVDSMNMAGAVYVNGALLARDNHLVEPLSRSWNRPRHWIIPQPLLRAGDNELLFRVSGMAFYQGGLGAVRLSTSPEVVAHYDRSQTFRRALLLAGIGVTLATLLVFGVVWLLRRSEHLYGWFALFSLCRLPSTYNHIATESWPYPDTPTFQLLNMGSLPASATCFLIFSLIFCRLPWPRVRRLGRGVVALCGGLLAALAFTPAPWLAQVRNLAMMWTMVLMVAGTCVVLWHALRTRRPEAIALALWLLLPMGAAVHDGLLFLRLIRGNYLFLFVSSLMLLGMASVMAMHLARGMRLIERFNAELRKRVDAATADLAEALRRQHATELEHTRLNERMSLVRDLHDGLGMSLSGHIHALQARGDAPDDAALWTLRDINNDLRLLIEGASLDDTDRLAERLAPLRHRSTRLLEAAGITCRWELHNLADSRLDARRSLDLLRLLQEALTNVLRHSQASEASVHLEATDGQLTLRVADNGRGFAPPADDGPREGGGMGLSSMRARAHRLGGVLAIDTGPQGTALTLRVPL